ncbi:MAG TPA: AAA family ATPase [Pirellulales bacterium]|jgi:general secretion pathway protein A|nr:AAA family ATPase [Pirellulales bacterium]
MYETYWKLREKPFECGADPRAYYPAETHQGALLKLRYAIENQRGAALLCGGFGTGKTLLLRLLAEQLPERFRLVHLVFPQMPAADVLAYLAAELGLSASSPSLADTVGRIGRRLVETAAAGRHVVAAIDDAQLLDGPRTFETLRLLLNFESSGRAALTLLFAGQPNLLCTLERMPQLDERLGAKCLLRPFTHDETAGYVAHRMKAAGAVRAIFEPDAVEALFHLAHGVPRRINRLCDLALLIGYAEEQRSIGARQVEAVGQELVVAAA